MLTHDLSLKGEKGGRRGLYAPAAVPFSQNVITISMGSLHGGWFEMCGWSCKLPGWLLT